MASRVVEKIVSQNAQEITKNAKSNFAWAFVGLSKKQRKALQALYAFCRVVDDIVDEASDPEKARQDLRRWREILGRLSSPSGFDPPVAWDLSHACRDFPIRVEDLAWVIDGVEMDLKKSRYDEFEDLLEYCDAVASAVGFASISIFGAERESTHAYTLATGRALQLTNILRDVGVDAKLERIYIPLEDLKRFSLKEKDLLLHKYSDRFRDMMAFQCDRVRTFYRESEATLSKRERQAFPAAELMRRMYERLLDRIESEHFNVFPRKICVANPVKVAVAMSIWIPHWLHLPRP